MTHETLTAERALQLLREVAAERPNYVYQSPVEASCVYIDPQTHEPSCLIGHVLIRAGWTVKELETVNRTDIGTLLERSGFDPNENVVRILSEAQERQDGENTWARALAYAEAVAAGETP